MTEVGINVAGAALACRLAGLKAVDAPVVAAIAVAVGAMVATAAGWLPPLAAAVLALAAAP